MITLLGKAKLHTIEVSDYVTQIEKIRSITENLIAFNKDATIEVWTGYLILNCKLCPTSKDYIARHYKIEENGKNSLIIK